jgi:hypothetical protein
MIVLVAGVSNSGLSLQTVTRNSRLGKPRVILSAQGADYALKSATERNAAVCTTFTDWRGGACVICSCARVDSF